MDLDAGSGRFSGCGRGGLKLDSLDVLDINVGDAVPGPNSGPDSGPVLDLDKSEPGLEAGPGHEKVLDWENGRFWDKLGVLDVLDENWEMDKLDKLDENWVTGGTGVLDGWESG